MEDAPGEKTQTGVDAVPAPGREPSRELVTRAASALVLAAVTLAVLYAGPQPFAVLAAAAALAASFEWSRIVRGAQTDAVLVVHLAAAGLAAVLAALGFAALGLAVVAVGAILAGLLSVGRHPLLSAMGVVYAALPAVALIWLREDEAHGLEAVLLILLAVAATDVAAFACGRLIGGAKLAPAVSPNKTWSGFLGGIAAAALVAAVFGALLGASVARLAGLGLLLGVLAQMGDLAESALKRRFGFKDSGSLIPGHGGIMDRIDGLVFAAVAAGLLALALDPHAPAGALVFGR